MRIEPGGSTTISPVYKPTAPTTPSLATQYQEAVAAAAAKARDEEMRKRKPVTPVGFGVPGYWWQGMTPFIAPGGMAAPVMTAGNGAGYNAGALGITDPYAGVTGADPTVPSADPTVPVDPTPTEAPPTEAPPTETPPTEDVIRPPKPKNFSESPAWATLAPPVRAGEKHEKDNQVNVGGIGNSTQNQPQGFVSAGGQGGMPFLVSPNPPPDWMKYWVARNDMLPKVTGNGSDDGGTENSYGGYSYTLPRIGGGYNAGGGGSSSYLPWWKWNLMNWRID